MSEEGRAVAWKKERGKSDFVQQKKKDRHQHGYSGVLQDPTEEEEETLKMEVVLLDERIALYVLIPIFLAVTLVALLRQNVAASVKNTRAPDLQRVHLNSLLQRSAVLRGPSSRLLPSYAFLTRKEMYVHEESGIFASYLEEFCKQEHPLRALENLAKMDPNQTMGMLKNQLSFIFLQGGIAYFVNYLFPDFLVAKMPFPLTYRFKPMLQRGIDLPSLDVTYVSSLSWYFLVMLSSSGLLFLVSAFWSSDAQQQQLQPLAEGHGEDQPNVQQALMMDAGVPPMMMMPGMGGPDPKKQIAQEKECWEKTTHEFALEGIERRLLQKFRAEAATATAASAAAAAGAEKQLHVHGE